MSRLSDDLFFVTSGGENVCSWAMSITPLIAIKVPQSLITVDEAIRLRNALTAQVEDILSR